MDLNQFESVRGVHPAEPTIKVTDVTGPDRTLLWGYDVDRLGFHVYLLEGAVHLARVNSDRVILSDVAKDVWLASDLVPNKRAFPERTDATFALLLAQTGTYVAYKNFDQERWEQTRLNAFHAPIAGKRLCALCQQPIDWDTEHAPYAWRHIGTASRWCATDHEQLARP